MYAIRSYYVVNELHNYTSHVDYLAFDDHHDFSAKDMELLHERFNQIKAEKKIIVTTEKDAMHFKDLGNLTVEFKEALYFLPVKIKFLDEEGKLFNKKILGYVGENKSNRELHKRKNSGKS